MPTLADVTAAWHALPAETRDRIGIIATDLVFQAFVHGDSYVAMGQFEDLPVYDPDIRDAAGDAENRRLTELHKVVEDALPDLFGKDANPAWCENPGTEPTEAARAWAAERRAERDADKARLEAELDAEDQAAEDMRERCAQLVEKIEGAVILGGPNDVARQIRALPLVEAEEGADAAA